MKSDLFGEKTIRDFISSINLTLKQKTSANAWIELLEKGELEEEVANYPRFMIHILQNILGYNITSFNHEEGNMEFAFKNDSGEFLVCFEAKGAKTEDLWKSQGRNVKVRETPVNQINDYLYKNKIPFGVLTNYREFVLFKREEGYTKFHKFNFLDIKGHPDKLKEFIAIFSRNSFEKKETEKLYEKSLIEEREFTKEFYKLYHETRLMLIREFEENTEISKGDSVHFAQIFLNRLMFVFFAEDTGKIENRTIEERLLKTLESKHLFSSNSNNISNVLTGLFRDLDKGSDFPTKLFGFNGGLFKHPIPERVHFKDFRDSVFFNEIYQNSKLKDKALNLNENEEKIFNEYKDKISPVIRNILLMSSFDFKSEVNVNILGHIFEQSISDIEDLKADETSRRKKEGIFYTPEYITDYICRNTIIPYLSKEGNAQTVSDLIGEYSEGIEELEDKFKEMKILDPACGSGAFLIKATDIMLEVFKAIQEFKQSEGEYKAFKFGSGRLGKKKLRDSEGQLNLFKWDEESEAREIIENNIYGVDINEESVEITKLSLFLKMARKNRKLTDLSKNIKQGNSLIDDESIAGKLAFDWNKEFKEIMDKSGFDIIIGNPPYGAKLSEEDTKYLNSKYKVGEGNFDSYIYFIGLNKKLLMKDGQMGYITPNTWMNLSSYSLLRKQISESCKIKTIINLLRVFEDAMVDCSIEIFVNSKDDGKTLIKRFEQVVNPLKKLDYFMRDEHSGKYFLDLKNDMLPPNYILN